MYQIKCANNISAKGTEQFGAEYAISESIANPDGILVRSAAIDESELHKYLLAIARAGVGVNNIPVQKCTEMGIVVFNTPGANANAVKELVLCGLLLTARRIGAGMDWVKTLKGRGDEISRLVEKEKSRFAGPELKGKKLGVVGLGAIGSLVANSALQLGMKIFGFDPYLSVESAWKISSAVHRAASFDEICAECDFITLHLPLTDETFEMINAEAIAKMKQGTRLLNFSRGELVNSTAVKDGLSSGKLAAYATDFPSEALIGLDNVTALPHLGASTPESEENCAVMAVRQLKDYIENGNICNSVNFASISMAREAGTKRICLIHRNIPNTIAVFAAECGKLGINIENMQSRSRGEYAYTILDVSGEIPENAADTLLNLKPIVRVIILP